MQLCNAMRQAYVRTYVRVHIRLHNCCVCLCAQEKKAGSKFDLLSEVIFQGLAVTAVTVKLMLESWFVLAVAMFY